MKSMESSRKIKFAYNIDEDMIKKYKWMKIHLIYSINSKIKPNLFFYYDVFGFFKWL